MTAAASTDPPVRQVVAIVLPRLALELALEREQQGREQQGREQQQGRRSRRGPLGVVVEEQAGEVEAGSRLAAVDEAAWRAGVRRGQTVAEARALVAGLRLHRVTPEQLRQALARVADLAARFGALVAVEGGQQAAHQYPTEEGPDTVWLDVTRSLRLFGGEQTLMTEIAGALTDGLTTPRHRFRLAMGPGPLLAAATARWAAPTTDPEAPFLTATPQRVAALPLAALPLEIEQQALLLQLGLQTFGDLAALPPEVASSRLGAGQRVRVGQQVRVDQAALCLQLVRGIDDLPLVAYEAPPMLTEASEWDEPLAGIEPVRFVLRGLVSRLSSRLQGRGQAAEVVELTLLHDRSVARLQGKAPQTTLRFDLASPLWREDDLRRVIEARLEQLESLPNQGLRLEIRRMTVAPRRQLTLDQLASGVGAQQDSLPVLLAELAGDIGADRLGRLEVRDGHLPEQTSVLVPVEPDRPRRSTPGKGSPRKGRELPLAKRARLAQLRQQAQPLAPTRLLPRPLPVFGRQRAPGAEAGRGVSLQVGATIAVEHRLYTVGAVAFEHRLDAVAWWGVAGARASSGPPQGQQVLPGIQLAGDAGNGDGLGAGVGRDYYRLRLDHLGADGQPGCFEALAFVDRASGRPFLQAILD